jgi:glc operon protein GlcG
LSKSFANAVHRYGEAINWEESMRHFFSIVSAICVVALMGVQVTARGAEAPVPPPPYGTPITLEQAKKAIDSAEAEARKRNLNVAIAIVEPSGDLVYFRRMDGVDYASIKIAQTKAISAATFRRPSKSFRDRVAAGDLSPMALAGAVASDGGVPIIVGGKIIGAIGTSGGSDGPISQAGADALK